MRHARDLVSFELIRAGWGGEIVEVARLLASELATNAVVHARGREYTVTIDITDERLHVGVSDDDPTQPSLRHAASGATDGRGLRLIEDLAERWGVDATATGKSVWFELDNRTR